MLTKLSVEEFLANLSTKQAPGSGSAAALIGAAGTGLLQMAGALCKDGPEMLQLEIAALGKLQRHLTSLIERDADVLAAAFPALTAIGPDGESEEWNAILQKAIEVPVAIAEDCLETMEIALKILTIAPPNVRCDVKFALLSCNAALQGAVLLTQLNIALLRDDEEMVLTLNDKINEISEVANDIMEQIKNKPDNYEMEESGLF